MAGIVNNTVYGTNVDFSGQVAPAPTITTNGQMLIGTTALNAGGTHINVGTLTSTGGSITISYSSPNINLEAANPGNLAGLIPDAHTSPGTTPVVPNGGGNITLEGGITFATGTQANPIRTNSLAANTIDFQIQLAGSNAAVSTPNNFGVAQFDANDFTVTSGFVTLKGGSPPIDAPGADNIGIAYSAGTFTVQGANGLALSATNPGFVTINSVNLPGRLFTVMLTANQTFRDNASGSSQIAGNSFGVTTTGAAYNQDIPYFLYAVGNSAQNGAGNIETAIAFMFSRYPNTPMTPVAGKIAVAGGTNASTQGSFYTMSGTAANYASSAALVIGSFRMQSTAAVADWTVQTLNSQDGIGLGHFQEGVVFTLPTGTFGAATGSLQANNGGTAPIFSINSNRYFVTTSNFFSLNTAQAVNTSAGLGNVNLQTCLPYICNGIGGGSILINANAGSTGIFIGVTSTANPGPNNKLICYQNSTSTAVGQGTYSNADVPANSGSPDGNCSLSLNCNYFIVFT